MTAPDNVLVKKPHQKIPYTGVQIDGFIKCVDPKTGPIYFMSHFFWIQHPTKGKLQYQPYAYQLNLLDSYHNYVHSISLMGRQLGKTTTASGYLLWFAMFNPDSTILIAAHKYSGALEIMQRIRYAYELCPDHIRAGCTGYNKGSIEFDNGSRILSQATTESTGRGLSITLLYLDEFSFVPPNIAAEFWTSISPTLSTGGKSMITSTPNNDEDQFAIIWKGANKCEDEYGNETNIGINGYKAFEAIWSEHPDRDEAWEKKERAKMSEDQFLREHCCQFVSFEETLINAMKLVNLIGIEPLFKHGQVRWYQQPKPGMIYCIALDPSLGTGGDPAAIQVFEANTTTQIAEWRHNKTPIPVQIRTMHEIISYINKKTNDPTNIYYSIENNTLGEAALISLEEYGEDSFPGMFLSEAKKKGSVRRARKGFTTTNKSKLEACAKLKTLVELDKMKIYSKSLISELKTFVALGAGYEAKQGETDDLVSATLLIVRMLTQLQNYHVELSDQIRDHAGVEVAPMPFIVF
jgi:hypothetical protein